jgi:hypothetical protein
MDIDELKRLDHTAMLAEESARELRSGQLSPGAYDSRWVVFHKEANPQTVRALISRIRQLESLIDTMLSVRR